MRKIFTILFILSLSYRWIDVQAQILWGGPNDPNSTFANGFNGWTTKGLSSSNTTKADSAIWTWSAAASGAGGAFWGGRKSINSPSKANGAMVFNSDFLDNGGDGNNQGNGKAPAPQSGVLISPVIDCSTFNTVAVKFNQYFRNYASTCFIDVTNDGGTTWVPFQVNRELSSSNDSTLTNNQTTINIGCVAAMQPAVQIRFRMEADYYFWIIDDVQLVVPPVYDLGINSTFYTPAAYRQPKSQICMDTFVFSASIINKGSDSQTNVVYKGEILDIDRKKVMFSDSIIIARLDPCIDTTFRTDNYFLPSSISGYGKYYIRWSLYSKDATGPDFNTKDNIKIDSFEISLGNYAKAPRATSGVRAGSGASYVWGNQYRTSDCWNANDVWIATDAKFQLVTNPGGTLNQYLVGVYLLRVHDDITSDFNNFDATMGIQSTSVDIVSIESFLCTTEKNYDYITVPLTDFGGEPSIKLVKNSRYFIGVDHPKVSGIPVFQVYSNEKKYTGQVLSSFLIDENMNWAPYFRNGESYSPFIELDIDLAVKTDNKPLPATTMQLYPNPVVDNNLRVKLSFDKSTDANLTIADINGRILGFESHSSVTNDVFTINTSELKAGNYLMRVSTEEGTSTKQFTVVK